jgi:hypothetical protein
VTTRLADLLGLLNVDTARARAELAKHTTEIRMIPEAGAEGKLQYVAEGEWNFFGGTDFAVVAGDRNERKVITLPFRLRVTDAAA